MMTTAACSSVLALSRSEERFYRSQRKRWRYLIPGCLMSGVSSVRGFRTVVSLVRRSGTVSTTSKRLVGERRGLLVSVISFTIIRISRRSQQGFRHKIRLLLLREPAVFSSWGVLREVSHQELSTTGQISRPGRTTPRTLIL